MSGKKPARIRAAEKRAKRAKRAKRTRQTASPRFTDLGPTPMILGPSPEQDLEDLQDTLWKKTDRFEDKWARAYLAKHGECAICRARVGVVSRSVRYVEAEPPKKPRQAHWDPFWVIEDAKALQRVVKELHGEGSQSVESDSLLFRGELLAEPILLSLAIEIALKAWQRRERQAAPDRSHDLLQLFKGLEEATQKRLQAKMPAMVDPLFKETIREGLRELLSSHRDAFIKWRYPYEGDDEGSIFKTFETAALHQALTVLTTAYHERESAPPEAE